MTGSRKKNKPHHPNQTIPSHLRASRILAAQNEARRKFNEMQGKQGTSGSSASHDVARKDDKLDLPFAMQVAESESEEEVEEGYMIVALPGGVEVPVVDAKKKAVAKSSVEDKTVSDGDDSREVKSTGGFWPWSRGISK
ncbi:hypothetical protein M409DRAFT_52498 [Zasmidium cellare ATCC 36951]|uniref:Uncharacterized protein n=1 Tax=Zasmidium cellare ATCC 36951 TaxID=1080233 RepID=A0A6A6CUR0_ZASCE|nr:uncharacterized protein M409DRAFT_52498 [Zasmidium cellare ATCC 36951]KAF2169226.1 hypothetical protein M409DRAFT_52498 [Zasmidium cellare ATCC 36951]